MRIRVWQSIGNSWRSRETMTGIDEAQTRQFENESRNQLSHLRESVVEEPEWLSLKANS